MSVNTPRVWAAAAALGFALAGPQALGTASAEAGDPGGTEEDGGEGRTQDLGRRAAGHGAGRQVADQQGGEQRHAEGAAHQPEKHHAGNGDAAVPCIHRILDGSVLSAPSEVHPVFKLRFPTSVAGANSKILNPRTTWASTEEYVTARAR